MKRFTFRAFLLFAITLAAIHFSPLYAFQDDNAGRVKKPEPKPPKASGKAKSAPKTTAAARPKPAPTAEITINSTPPGCSVILDGKEHATDKGGVLKLRGVKPGGYTLVVRKQNYREEQRPITLIAGQNAPLSFALVGLPGTLNVSPGVNAAAISISDGIGEYTGTVSNLSIKPGSYQVTVSRFGYRKATKQIEIRPNQVLNLDVPLEPTPTAELLAQAEAELHNNQTERVIELCTHILQTQADQPRAHHLLGLAYFKIGNTGSVAHLLSAIRLGEQVPVPIKYHTDKTKGGYVMTAGSLIFSKDNFEFRPADGGQSFSVRFDQIKINKLDPGEKGGRIEMKAAGLRGKDAQYHFHPAQATAAGKEVVCQNCLRPLEIIHTLLASLKAPIRRP